MSFHVKKECDRIQETAERERKRENVRREKERGRERERANEASLWSECFYVRTC